MQKSMKSEINGKFAEISVLNGKVTIFKKLTFHSVFISVVVNTASVSIDFDHTSYFLAYPHKRRYANPITVAFT